MFNTQVYIGPDGTLIRKHQKIMPTVGERLVHTGGYGDTFGAFASEFGPMSALICGENSNPLAIFALIAEGTRIHVMSWPNHFPTSGDPLRNRVAIDSQAFAQMSKAFVISACGTVDERMIEMLEADPAGKKFLRDPNYCGGSLIVDPLSRIIAGPMGAEEGILYAECNLDLGIQMKLRHDFAGHYNRPDIFHLHINRAAPQLYSVHGAGSALPNIDTEELLTAYYCAFDRKTPTSVKATLVGALAYFVLPIDAIPDFLPVLGFTDDAAFLAAAIKLVTDHIRSEHRDAAKRVLADFR